MSSTNVVRIAERARVEDYLGPARVVRVEGARIEVEMPDGAIVAAELALAFPYAPAVDDTLLVIGKGASLYVIGVLHGTGKTTFAMPGDVGVHAAGALHLSGAQGVKIEGPEIELHTGKLRTIADTVLHTCSSLYQRVTELFSVHAGSSHTLVDGDVVQQSNSAAIVTKETVTINGDQIHLG